MQIWMNKPFCFQRNPSRKLTKMNVIKYSGLSLLFPVAFLLSSTFFSLSHGVPTDPLQQGFRRNALEVAKGEAAGNGTLVLAADRTHRKDPLDHFNYYTGGWNISNKNYFSSVAFTAAPFIAIAVVWFVIMGLSLLISCLCCCCCCGRPKRLGYSRLACALSLIFIVLFTVPATLGSAILYSSQEKFYDSIGSTISYVLHQLDTIFSKLDSLSSYLQSIKQTKIDRQDLLPPELQQSIDQLASGLDHISKLPELNTYQSSDRLKHVLQPARHSLNVVAAVMLFLAFLGLLFSLFGVQFLVYILVIVGWILITITFILCAIFLLFHNVVGDTCVAMDQWVQNPTADSALSQILPCMDNETAQQTLTSTEEVTYGVVNLVNAYLANVTNNNLPPEAGPFYHHQSGPPVPLLCNPLDSDLNQRQCAPGEVGLGDAPQEWKQYVCQASSDDVCTTQGRLTPSSYDTLMVALNLTYGLDHFGPFLLSLADCSFIRDTFRDISKRNCPNLMLTSKWIYNGLLILSGSVMLSLLFWMLHVRQRQRRRSTRQAAHVSHGYHAGNRLSS